MAFFGQDNGFVAMVFLPPMKGCRRGLLADESFAQAWNGHVIAAFSLDWKARWRGNRLRISLINEVAAALSPKA